MKRLTLLTIIFMTAAFVFARDTKIFIREMTGTVEIKPPGSQEWVPARIEEHIDQATVISTGIKSSAVLVAGSSVITIRPLTSMNVEKVISEGNTETVGLELRSGRVRVDVSPPAGTQTDFSVKTPRVVASVRGTSFELDTMNIKVTEGTVRYVPVARTAVRPVMVNANQSSWIDTDTGKAVNPLAAAEKDRALPELPGQESAPAAGKGAGAESITGPGYLDLNITLESK